MGSDRSDPCSFFAAQSKYVWQRIAFARENNVRISETSITEELIFQFYRAFWESSIAVKIFESVDEHRNGSDLEILIKTGRGFILLPCQAKITYKTGSYQAFWHKVRGIPQIDLLRDYARRKGGIAQYLLYNYIPDWKFSPECLAIEDIENYGLTHISADEIYNMREIHERSGKKMKVPGFTSLHPGPAHPLHILICALLEDSEPFEDFFPETSLTELKYYDDQGIRESDDWREMTRLGQIGFVERDIIEHKVERFEESARALSANATPFFRPKFRLVIGGTRQQGRIRRVE